MFLVFCPAHGTEVLLGSSRIRRLGNVRGLVVVELECHDGERILQIAGRRAHEVGGSGRTPHTAGHTDRGNAAVGG